MSKRAKKTRKKVNMLFRILFIIITVILILLSPTVFNKIIRKKMYKKEYSEYVSKYAKEYDVDENLVYALIKAESNFNAKAESGKGAIGLMQLMESTAQDVCKKTNLNISDEDFRDELLEPETNINIGTKYLSTLIKKYGNVEIAITAYNAGIGTVDTWIEKGIIKADGSDVENIPYKETNNYVRKILRDYKIYTNL